ncbi:MAG TPA: cytochrome c oxidase assembly protein [Caulobacteraceae bacterium]
MAPPHPYRAGRRNGLVALVCAGVFVAMVGAAFASVPLYRAFCQATGFNGTVRRGPAAPGAVSMKTVTVRFDTNVRGLSWRFAPAQSRQVVQLGESKLAFFRATNIGPAAVTGRALYNVLPEWAGAYFSKLECFCFKNQTIAPGQTVEFPVVYVVDPRYESDPERRDVGQITLSYTFFPAPDAVAASAAASSPSALGGERRAGL